jgi:glyoxylase-like metal-dependent hydrolase (beta-lactamase superfamily II)
LKNINLSLKLLLLSIFALNISAYAEVPQTPIAGFYRAMVGDIEVIALSDGLNKRTVEQQLQLLQGDKDEIKTLLDRSFPDGQIASSVNAFLIKSGNKLVLVDTGNGSMGSPTMGKVAENLREAGHQPADIDEIYLTHMHGDHVGGLLAGTERAFPNATVYASKREADFWLSESNLNAAPDDTKRFYLAAQKAMTPYIAADKFKAFEANVNLLPGIRTEQLFGHTPGHTAYFIESKGKTLVLWGDIIHVAAVQFENPAVTISFDSDSAEAAKARQQILAKAAKNNWLIGGAHLPFSGLGYVRAKSDTGYSFLPLH